MANRTAPTARLTIRRASPSEARRQAEWIVGLSPWRELGYRSASLGRWLARVAGRGWVLVATSGPARRVRESRRGGPAGPSRKAIAPSGILVLQPEVLLGRFISLLAVRPEAAGQGMGRALVEAAAGSRPLARWLYTSSDSTNRVAAGFYRRLGFRRVGRLPDLVRPGHVEILWRRGTPPQGE